MKYSTQAIGLLLVALLVSGCGGGDIAQDHDAGQPATSTPLLPQAGGTVLDAETFFDWVPTQYAQHFAGAYQTGVSGSYSYRYYPSTRNYLAVSGTDVYVLGPVSAGLLQKVGPLSQFSCTVLPSSCTTAAPAATLPAAPLSGIYLGTDTGVSPGAFLLIDGNGRFYGYNATAVGPRVDYLAGTATTSGGAWSSSRAYFAHVGSLPGLSSSADISGTVTGTGALNASLNIHAGSYVSNRLDMYYDSRSNLSSSLARVSGNYTAPSTGQNITIRSTTGAISGALSRGCTVNGAIAVLDPAKNIYPVNVTLAGTGCPATGVIDMLAFYYTANNGASTLVMFGSGASGASTNFVLLAIPRSG